jgi:hypothetical protein
LKELVDPVILAKSVAKRTKLVTLAPNAESITPNSIRRRIIPKTIANARRMVMSLQKNTIWIKRAIG